MRPTDITPADLARARAAYFDAHTQAVAARKRSDLCRAALRRCAGRRGHRRAARRYAAMEAPMWHWAFVAMQAAFRADALADALVEMFGAMADETTPTGA